jgi:hypothetical protein
VAELKHWREAELLSAAVDHLEQWSREGLLCVGDSAHAMSPIGGVGINLAKFSGAAPVAGQSDGGNTAQSAGNAGNSGARNSASPDFRSQGVSASGPGAPDAHSRLASALEIAPAIPDIAPHPGPQDRNRFPARACAHTRCR